MQTIALLSLGLLIFVANFLSFLSTRTRLPDILILILIGFVLGPVMGLVPNDFFGGVGNVFAVVTLVFILFGAGLELGFPTLRRSVLKAAWLSLINYLATLLVLTPLSIIFFKLTILEGLILGSILGQTSAAIVIPLVGQLKLQEDSKSILILESMLGDVFSILIALALIQSYRLHELHVTLLVGSIVASFIIAVVFGIIAGLFWSTVLTRIRQIKNSFFLTPAFVFIIYGANELMGFSGPIAALTCGVFLGNIETLQKMQNLPFLQGVSLIRFIQRSARMAETDLKFLNEIIFLIKAFFFVYIGLSIRLNDMALVTGSLLLTASVLIIRIPVVKLALDKKVPKKDASIASVIISKGVTTAALATLVIQAGLPHGETVKNITYLLILFCAIATIVFVFLIEKTPLQRLYGLFFSRVPIIKQEIGFTNQNMKD